MSLRLVLIRHTKSARPRGVADHDRPLNGRGRAAAASLSRWLAEAGLTPGEALCSDARRTRETWEGIAAGLPGAARLRLEPRLYEAGADDILAVLHAATTPVVALIGHNPGIGETASRLLHTAPDHPRFADYPTGATLVARFATEAWRALRWGTGRAEHFVVPRDH